MAPRVSSERSAIEPVASTLLRSHGMEISEHRLNLLALAARTRRVRRLMLGNVLLTLEDRAALLAPELIGRDQRCLQTGMQCTPKTRKSPPARRGSVSGRGTASAVGRDRRQKKGRAAPMIAARYRPEPNCTGAAPAGHDSAQLVAEAAEAARSMLSHTRRRR
jgi:hypothetical protein